MKRTALTLILLAAALLRVGLLATAWNAPPGLATPDSAEYSELARSMIQTGEFARDGRPEIFRTPGYPTFLMLSAPFGGGWWRLNAAVQIAVDVGLVYLTYLLGTMLCSRGVGLWAAAFCAVSPIAAVASVRILSDGLFALLLTLAVLLAVHHFRHGDWWSLLASAATMAAGCYVRPVGLALAAPFAIVLLTRKMRFRRGGAFAGIVIIAIVPWVVRNGLTADYWAFSNFASDSAYRYSAPLTLAAAEDIPLRLAIDRMERREFQAMGAHPGVGELARYRSRTARRILTEHPWTYAKIHLRSMAAFWLPGVTDALEVAGVTAGQRGTLTVLRREGLTAAVRHYFGPRTWAIWLVVPLVAILAVKYLAAVGCLIARLARGMPAGGWLALGLIVVAAILPGPAAHPRFRVPVQPLLAVAAGCGIVGVWARLRRRQARPTQSSD